MKTMMYLGYDAASNSIITCFRGTENILNWITDADFIKVDYPGCEGCEVHKGFYNAYTALQDRINRNLQ